MEYLLEKGQAEALFGFIQSLGPHPSTNLTIPLNRRIAMVLGGRRYQYLCFPEGTLLLSDEDDYHNLYYIIKNGFDISRRDVAQDLKGIDKPVILESVRSNVRSTMTEVEKFQWQSYGFQEYVQTEKMCYAAREAQLHRLPSGFSCIPACGKQMESAVACFSETFDPLSDLLPSADVLLSENSGHAVYTLSFKSHPPIGYLHFTCGRRFSELLHFCVVPEQRGKGYGKILLTGYLSVLEHLQIPRAILWVHSGNAAAKRVYLQAGFTFDGKAAEKYIYRA